MSDLTRTDDTEPRADVWFVKVNETQAGVIVQFTDAGEEDPVGIYLFEPGADPVELVGVRIDGAASEFEYATVTAEIDRGCEDTEGEISYPGDVMITRADADALVSAAVEAHETLVDNHEKLTEQTRALIDAARQDHHEHHAESFAWCGFAVCKAAAVLTRVVNL